jgi:hypothetical protein
MAYLIIGDRQRRAAALADRVEDEIVRDGDRHADAGGECLGVLPQLGLVRAGLERLHDRRATVRLDGDHLRALRTYPTQRLQLVERLPHADDAGAAACWV